MMGAVSGVLVIEDDDRIRRSLVLALGEKVCTVPGERTNLKVTFREDLMIAEAILKNGARE